MDTFDYSKNPKKPTNNKKTYPKKSMFDPKKIEQKIDKPIPVASKRKKSTNKEIDKNFSCALNMDISTIHSIDDFPEDIRKQLPAAVLEELLMKLKSLVSETGAGPVISGVCEKQSEEDGRASILQNILIAFKLAVTNRIGELIFANGYPLEYVKAVKSCKGFDNIIHQPKILWHLCENISFDAKIDPTTESDCKMAELTPLTDINVDDELMEINMQSNPFHIASKIGKLAKCIDSTAKGILKEAVIGYTIQELNASAMKKDDPDFIKANGIALTSTIFEENNLLNFIKNRAITFLENEYNSNKDLYEKHEITLMDLKREFKKALQDYSSFLQNDRDMITMKWRDDTHSLSYFEHYFDTTFSEFLDMIHSNIDLRDKTSDFKLKKEADE